VLRAGHGFCANVVKKQALSFVVNYRIRLVKKWIASRLIDEGFKKNLLPPNQPNYTRKLLLLLLPTYGMITYWESNPKTISNFS